jgi:hypothetical protein
MKAKLAAALAAIMLVTGGGAAAAPGRASAAETIPARSAVLASMERVADWQLGHLDKLDYTR